MTATRLRAQQMDPAGSAPGDVVTSNGPGVPPTWQAPSGGGGVGLSLLQSASHDPGTYTTTTTTVDALAGTLTDVDATNLAVTFTPTGSAVWLMLSAFAYISNSGNNHYWGVKVGSTLVTGSRLLVTAATVPILVTQFRQVTGLTPGASVTWKWGMGSQGTHTATLGRGGGNGPATMAVFEA